MKKRLLTIIFTALISVGPDGYVDENGTYYMKLPTGNIAATDGTYYDHQGENYIGTGGAIITAPGPDDMLQVFKPEER